MPSPTPRVSVLMTTRNGARTISDSLQSILTQDMPDFELVVVDDASSDKTPALLSAITDPRLVLLRNDSRLGIAGARNRGLAQARAPYIAALDHDDLSAPTRLGLQAAYLDNHPDTVLVATAVSELRDGKQTPEDQPRQISPALLRLLLHLDNPLAWSSVMLRADALRSLDPPLRPQFEPADDFDLYHRLLGRGHIARLDPELTTCRWHASNATYATGANIADGATRVLTRAYTPWFGADAPAAASLVVRHGHERNAVADATTMARLRDVTRRAASGLAASHPAEASEITAGSRRLLWRFTRAAVRPAVQPCSAYPHPRWTQPPRSSLAPSVFVSRSHGACRSVSVGRAIFWERDPAHRHLDVRRNRAQPLHGLAGCWSPPRRLAQEPDAHSPRHKHPSSSVRSAPSPSRLHGDAIAPPSWRRQ